MAIFKTLIARETKRTKRDTDQNRTEIDDNPSNNTREKKCFFFGRIFLFCSCGVVSCGVVVYIDQKHTSYSHTKIARERNKRQKCLLLLLLFYFYFACARSRACVCTAERKTKSYLTVWQSCDRARITKSFRTIVVSNRKVLIWAWIYE